MNRQAVPTQWYTPPELLDGVPIFSVDSHIARLSDSAGVETTNPNTPATAGTPTTGAKTYTRADVAKHNVQTDCWTTVNGGVYDVTTWIKQHPGGAQAIIGLCGIDGSDAFNGQHGGERRPASELALFKIGDLAK
jgi:cytochrome b involved in lipid metabolism